MILLCLRVSDLSPATSPTEYSSDEHNALRTDMPLPNFWCNKCIMRGFVDIFVVSSLFFVFLRIGVLRMMVSKLVPIYSSVLGLRFVS